MKKNTIFVALGVAGVIALAGFTVFDPRPVSWSFTTPADQCMPTGVGVLQTAQLMINEVVRPECK
jgi:hypothetical protein